MKTKLIFLLLFILGFSCRRTNEPLSDSYKDKVKGEIKEVVNKMFAGNEELNINMVIEPFFDSPDFRYLIHGYTLNYNQLIDGIKPVFNTLLNQQVTIVDEKFTFIDKSIVLYTTNCKLLENFKDGHSSLNDPTAILYIFKKIGGNWKIIYGAETFVKKDPINSNTPPSEHI